MRRVPDDAIDRIRSAGLYRVLLPRRFGGLEFGWIEFLRIAETLPNGGRLPPATEFPWGARCG